MIGERVGVDAVVVTNRDATRKFMRETRFKYLLVNTREPEVTPERVVELSRRYGEVVIVLLDRSDSDFWRRQALENAAFIEALDPPPRLELDQAFSPTDHLRIWRLEGD